MIEYGEFSFSDVKNDTDTDSENVKTDGFVNTDELETDDPDWMELLERAKAEVDVDYNLTQTFYDEREDVWMVHFFNSDSGKRDEKVYFNGKGRTLLIVYGQ